MADQINHRICSRCGLSYGYVKLGDDVSYSRGQCEWCGEKTATTDSKAFGYPELSAPRIFKREGKVAFRDR